MSEPKRPWRARWEPGEFNPWEYDRAEPVGAPGGTEDEDLPHECGPDCQEYHEED